MSTRYVVAAALLAIGFSAPPAGAQVVGNVGAVNPDASSQPPGAGSRKLTLGAGVVQRERVQTDAQGSAQITFNDRSSLNIGRNSNIVIDKFVFDPSTGAGQMTANMTRGALRFVGGQVSHTTGVTIQTPAATIGVRGGVATIAHDSSGALRVINNYGVVTVTNSAGEQVIRRPGFEVIVNGAGSPPGDPHRVDPATLSRIMAQLTSAKGQRGGAATQPTDTGSARYGIGSPRHNVTSPTMGLPPVGNVTGTENQRLDSLNVPRRYPNTNSGL